MRAGILAIVLALAGCAAEPDFLDAQGQGHSFAALQGKWIVVNYWATWCGPCIAEIKELNELHHGRDDLVVFGINYDGEKGEVLDRQIARMGINFPVFAGDVPDQYRFDFPLVLPTTHIVGPDGQLRETFVGPQTLATFDEAAGGGPGD
ncbi:MAG: thioredoxin [Gammaproteobacteria bacterium]|nr:thioredoxin [Gammaproteobacteria bacterium]